MLLSWTIPGNYFRLGYSNIGPLIIKCKGYHKNETGFRNNFKVQQEFPFQLFDCMHIKNIFLQANLPSGQN